MQDLKKAIWYISREISNIEKGVYNGKGKQTKNETVASTWHGAKITNCVPNAKGGYTFNVSVDGWGKPNSDWYRSIRRSYRTGDGRSVDLI
jgi:hypothetical protein